MIGKNIKELDKVRDTLMNERSIAYVLAFLFVAGPVAGRLSAASTSPLVQVLGVRQLSEEDSRQVIVDLEAQVRYTVGHLPNPERIYVDLLQTKIHSQLKSRLIVVGDSLIARVRIGTNRDSVTRVVLDLHSPLNYGVFEQSNPPRLVIALNQGNGGEKTVEPSTQSPTGEATSESSASAPGRSRSAFGQVVGSSNLASDQIPQATTGSGPIVYGSGEKPGISYGDNLSARNILLVNMNLETTYNDNILNTARPRIGDETFLVGPNFSLRRDARKLSLALNYQPDFRIYRQTSSLNTTDQSLSFDSTYRASSRLSLRARASVSYTNGILDSHPSDQFVPGLASPSSLNQTLFTPTARQLTDNFRVDATYRAGLRDSVALFGGFSAQDFYQQPTGQGNLTNMQEKDAGLLYSHRLNSHDTLGISYMFRDFRLVSEPRTLVGSSSLSFAKQIWRSVTVDVFGGPEYVSCLNNAVAIPLDSSTSQTPICRNQWTWAAGGDLTTRTQRNVFQITAQHQVSDGGGLAGLVDNTYLGGTVRRRLGRRWEVVWSGGYARNNALESGSFQNDFQTQNADVSLEHSLTQRVSIRLGYDFVHQRNTGPSVALANINRDIWYVRLAYGLGQIPLGR